MNSDAINNHSSSSALALAISTIIICCLYLLRNLIFRQYLNNKGNPNDNKYANNNNSLSTEEYEYLLHNKTWLLSPYPWSSSLKSEKLNLNEENIKKFIKNRINSPSIMENNNDNDSNNNNNNNININEISTFSQSLENSFNAVADNNNSSNNNEHANANANDNDKDNVKSSHRLSRKSLSTRRQTSKNDSDQTNFIDNNYKNLTNIELEPTIRRRSSRKSVSNINSYNYNNSEHKINENSNNSNGTNDNNDIIDNSNSHDGISLKNISSGSRSSLSSAMSLLAESTKSHFQAAYKAASNSFNRNTINSNTDNSDTKQASDIDYENQSQNHSDSLLTTFDMDEFNDDNISNNNNTNSNTNDNDNNMAVEPEFDPFNPRVHPDYEFHDVPDDHNDSDPNYETLITESGRKQRRKILHRRSWTHTNLWGYKELRIHRKEKINNILNERHDSDSETEIEQ